MAEFGLKFDWSQPILKVLEDAGVEPDQRVLDALLIASPAAGILAANAVPTHTILDSHLFLALGRLNARGSEHVPLEKLDRVPGGLRIPEGKPRVRIDQLRLVGDNNVHKIAPRILEQAIASGKNSKSLGATDLLKAIVEDAFEYGETYINRGYAVDVLTKLYGADYSTPLSEVPEAQKFLRALEASINGDDDYQYVMAMEEGRFVFRVVSRLGDYVERGESGLVVPQRALLTHIDGLGLFTADAIGELEDLLNSATASEDDFQEFFERHPHFLRRWDHREVHPHVYLTREEDGPLVPDFILTNRETQQAAIVDLKLPGPKLIRRQKNRVRFSAVMTEALSQLHEYRDWFEQPNNREMLKDKLGMEVYRPRLMVVIGRASEFTNAYERQKLQSRTPDVDVVTYDDIVQHARQRRVFIETGRIE